MRSFWWIHSFKKKPTYKHVHTTASTNSRPGQSQSIVINQRVNNMLSNNNKAQHIKINVCIYFLNWRIRQWPSHTYTHNTTHQLYTYCFHNFSAILIVGFNFYCDMTNSINPKITLDSIWFVAILWCLLLNFSKKHTHTHNTYNTYRS